MSRVSRQWRLKEWVGTDCLICGFPIADIHRVIPGKRGGLYLYENVIPLCPNHHRALHFLMDSLRLKADGSIRSKYASGSGEASLAEKLLQDERLASLFAAITPHQRTLRGLPVEEQYAAMSRVNASIREWKQAHP